MRQETAWGWRRPAAFGTGSQAPADACRDDGRTLLHATDEVAVNVRAAERSAQSQSQGAPAAPRPLVVIAEPLAHEAMDILRAAGVEIRVPEGSGAAGLAALLPRADALIVRSKTVVDASMIRQAPRLRVVARAGVGVDAIDVAEATRHGILVLNAPDASTVAVAEHTLALMLMLVRGIEAARARIAAGQWSSRDLVGGELAGKRLGIVGLGRIGTAVAVRALAFGMQVTAHDVVTSQARADALGVGLASLDELLAGSDILTLHVPLTAHTRGLIGERELGRMKSGAYIVNCSRGGLIDEAALLAAVESGHLAGAALDVVAGEPPPAGAPVWQLLHHPRVIATPHVGGATREAQAKIAAGVCRDVLAALRGEPPASAVNAPAAPAEVAPFVRAAHLLGRLYTQIAAQTTAQNAAPALGLTLEGDLAGYGAEPFVAAFLAGLLGQVSERRISIANARAVAEDMGISLEVLRSECRRGFGAAISARGGETALAAGVVHGTRIRLIEIDGFDVEVAPQPHLLLTKHRDVPGVVGRVGTILGQAGINIATMSVARDDGGQALLLCGVDRAPAARELQRIRRIPGLMRAVAVTL
jgi:D-3-phosphoglycerate dehydrogenase